MCPEVVHDSAKDDHVTMNIVQEACAKNILKHSLKFHTPQLKKRHSISQLLTLIYRGRGTGTVQVETEVEVVEVEVIDIEAYEHGWVEWCIPAIPELRKQR